MKILLIASLLVLVSCATRYQKMGFTGGYEEEKVAQDTYEVTFSGNGYTSRATVQRFLQRRCAELAKEKGFTHFIMANDSQNGYEKPWNSATVKLVNNPDPNMIAYDADIIIKKTAD